MKANKLEYNEKKFSTTTSSAFFPKQAQYKKVDQNIIKFMTNKKFDIGLENAKMTSQPLSKEVF